MYSKVSSINLPNLVDFVDGVIDTHTKKTVNRYVSQYHAATIIRSQQAFRLAHRQCDYLMI